MLEKQKVEDQNIRNPYLNILTEVVCHTDTQNQAEIQKSRNSYYTEIKAPYFKYSVLTCNC